MGAEQANVRAFISVLANDEIRDMPANYGVGINYPVQSPNETLIANDWADLIDDTILVSLQSAGIALDSTSWWSGSFGDGAITPIDTCSTWTSNTPNTMSIGGSTGTTTGTSSFLLTNISNNCSVLRHILCIAFD